MFANFCLGSLIHISINSHLNSAHTFGAILLIYLTYFTLFDILIYLNLIETPKQSRPLNYEMKIEIEVTFLISYIRGSLNNSKEV